MDTPGRRTDAFYFLGHSLDASYYLALSEKSLDTREADTPDGFQAPESGVRVHQGDRRSHQHVNGPVKQSLKFIDIILVLLVGYVVDKRKLFDVKNIPVPSISTQVLRTSVR